LAKQLVKLKDLAQQLGLSVSTVSKALNDSHEISHGTKVKVLALSKKLKYRPNTLAKNLKQNRTNTIGVIIPDLLNYYFVKALNGIQESAEKQGYSIITCITNESLENEVRYSEMLTNGSVDGLIVALSIETQKNKHFNHFKQLIKNEFPLVLFDRVSDEINCSQIISNDASVGAQAAHQLYIAECRNPLLAVVNSDLEVIKRREEGFTRKWYQLSAGSSVIRLEVLDLDDSEKEISDFLYNNNKIDGAFAVDERLGIKTLKCAIDIGRNVPENFKIIAASNGELSKEYAPSLSVIDLQENKIGSSAAEEVVRLIKSNVLKPKTTIIAPKFLPRQSS
jgi:LacI family transcriptional regulator